MQFDLIIIGGGMVGGALASALRHHDDYRIALIDAASLQPSNDERLIALNDSSVSLFENIGLQTMIKKCGTPIKKIHVSHRGCFGATRIDATTVGLQTLGCVIPAKDINAAIDETLLSAKNLTLIRPATLESLTQTTDGVTVTVKTREGVQTYSTKKLIGADGSYSTVRQSLAIPVEEFDYQQSALVTVTKLSRSHEHVAYERFQTTGAIAMLPLGESSVATIWTDLTESIHALMALSDEKFLVELQKKFGYRLGRLQSIGKRSIYPLKMVISQAQIKNNIALIGNAAHTLHPIAAQGFNLALFEVAVLVEHALDFSSDVLQQSFKQKRFSRELSHRLSLLFASDFFLMSMARQWGMMGFDLSGLAKKLFMNASLGRSGCVPSLLIRKNA